jgi:hypothetical protein
MKPWVFLETQAFIRSPTLQGQLQTHTYNIKTSNLKGARKGSSPPKPLFDVNGSNLNP